MSGESATAQRSAAKCSVGDGTEHFGDGTVLTGWGFMMLVVRNFVFCQKVLGDSAKGATTHMAHVCHAPRYECQVSHEDWSRLMITHKGSNQAVAHNIHEGVHA